MRDMAFWRLPALKASFPATKMLAWGAKDLYTGYKAWRVANNAIRARNLLPLFSTGGNSSAPSWRFLERADQLREELREALSSIDEAKWGLFQVIGQTLKVDSKCECQSK